MGTDTPWPCFRPPSAALQLFQAALCQVTNPPSMHSRRINHVGGNHHRREQNLLEPSRGPPADQAQVAHPENEELESYGT